MHVVFKKLNRRGRIKRHRDTGKKEGKEGPMQQTEESRVKYEVKQRGYEIKM